jgi:serine/threonine protein kinase
VKIGHSGQSPSRLHHEYNVYMSIVGSVGTASVLWYGKEDLYEVIVLEYLGSSLGDLINTRRFNHGEVFSYARQMVCSLYLYR